MSQKQLPKSLRTNDIDRLRDAAAGIFGQNKLLKLEKADILESTAPTFGSAVPGTLIGLGGGAASGGLRAVTKGWSRVLEPIIGLAGFAASWGGDSHRGANFFGGYVNRWWSELVERGTVGAVSVAMDTVRGWKADDGENDVEPGDLTEVPDTDTETASEQEAAAQ